MLVGKDIVLRPVEENDLQIIADWRNQPEIRPFFFNAFPISYAGQRGWFERLRNSPTRVLFVIEQLKDRTTIGTIGLDHIDYKNQKAEYGNMLIGSPQNWGQGCARDATHTLLRFAFDELNLQRLYLHVLDFNERAIGLYRKCGFVIEGRLRGSHFSNGEFHDVIVMGLLRSEYARPPL